MEQEHSKSYTVICSTLEYSDQSAQPRILIIVCSTLQHSDQSAQPHILIRVFVRPSSSDTDSEEFGQTSLVCRLILAYAVLICVFVAPYSYIGNKTTAFNLPLEKKKKKKKKKTHVLRLDFVPLPPPSPLDFVYVFCLTNSPSGLFP